MCLWWHLHLGNIFSSLTGILEGGGGLPRWLSGKESACSAGDVDSVSGSGRSLEKEMATHSSILAWEMPWTEEPGGLQSMGLQRVRHDLPAEHTYIHKGRIVLKLVGEAIIVGIAGIQADLNFGRDSLLRAPHVPPYDHGHLFSPWVGNTQSEV